MTEFTFLSKSLASKFGKFLQVETGTKPTIGMTEESSETTIPNKVWKVWVPELELTKDQLQRCQDYQLRLSAERAEHIRERVAEFQTLRLDELDRLWEGNQSRDSDEIDALRGVLRKAKRIPDDPGRPARVCRGCGMLEDNCICERS
jgi:hypothetical protein